FIYILISNLLGLIPEFYPPTINLNTNFAIASIVFIMYNYYGFRENGLSYIKHFTGPMWALAILYFPIEIFSHLFRPVTLSVRLFGNIFGDHNVIEIFQGLIPIGVPVLFMFLGIIVAIMQAFVFALLTIIYIALAVSHEH
ncbi:MAG TPA: F0F1 ATP synthase subunit A, partial [Nitrospinota bacterium]|nr:F0F1 ATP synthase subunit A [Nitrospinota bacterium]